MGLQGLNLRKKQYLALVGDSRYSYLAEVMKISTGKPSLRILAQEEGSLKNEGTVTRLLTANTESLHGDISVALPLEFFEIITASLPMMAEEAVGKALPYHLAKLIDKPLPEYIYDWQITQRQRDKLEITAYLLPRKIFNQIQKEFAKKQVTISFIEADVFAAFAFLVQNDRLHEGETTLCALLWPDTLSLAVYENKILTLVRTVKKKQPATPFISSELAPESPIPEDGQSSELEPTPAQNHAPESAINLTMENDEESPLVSKSLDVAENDNDDILAGFDLFTPVIEKKEEEEILSEKQLTIQNQVQEPVKKSELKEKNEWPEYLQNINLEIMRTRDYYSSVKKGGAIKKLIVSGAENFWEELKELTQHSLDMELDLLTQSPLAPNSPPTINALCIGTGTRW